MTRFQSHSTKGRIAVSSPISPKSAPSHGQLDAVGNFGNN